MEKSTQLLGKSKIVPPKPRTNDRSTIKWLEDQPLPLQSQSVSTLWHEASSDGALWP